MPDIKIGFFSPFFLVAHFEPIVKLLWPTLITVMKKYLKKKIVFLFHMDINTKCFSTAEKGQNNLFFFYFVIHVS